MVMYSFIAPFRERNFVVCRQVSDKSGCVSGEKSSRNAALDVGGKQPLVPTGQRAGHRNGDETKSS